jgi:hypothetical protein
MQQQNSILRLEWSASRRLALLLALAHVLSMAAVLTLSLAWWGKALVVALLGASAWLYISRARKPSWQPPRWLPSLARFTALELNSDGTSAARTLDGQWHDAQLGAAFAAPLFAIVQVKLEGRRWPRFVVFMPDMLAREDYRRLLVRLRWGNLDAQPNRA